jgi:nucleoside-diphosphate-sugar epimerase
MPDKFAKSISIIGCGWLGMPLALALKNHGFKVQGTVRTLSKTERFNNSGIHFYQLDLNPENECIPEIDSEFWQSDIFILTIPPTEPSNYCKGISKILDMIAKQPRRLSIIYTSSTGIYGKGKGLTEETSPPKPDRSGAAAVVECEELLLGKKDIFDVCILRLAGLVGPGRAPGRFFAGKKNLGSGSSPVNLVQLDDCVGIIVRLIEQEIKWIGDFLLQQEMTRDQQLIRLIREGGLAQNCPLGVEVPSDSCVRGDNDIRFEHMKTRRRARHKPEPMRGEFDGTAVPVLGGVVDLEKHLVGLRKWSLPSRVMSKPFQQSKGSSHWHSRSLIGIFIFLISLSKRHTKNDAS